LILLLPVFFCYGDVGPHAIGGLNSPTLCFRKAVSGRVGHSALAGVY
jgi:hypothetical protein